jgi:hypothetical protein
MTILLNGTTGIQFPDSSLQTAAASPFGLKNKIINGDMVISQRNGTSSITPTTDGPFSVDRWISRLSAASKYSIQQNAGSVTPPTGFTNYVGITSLSAYTVTSGDYFAIEQRIEGFNTADLAFGTANARTITLSFKVRSSLTGTFGGSISNDAFNRSYAFSYSISSANTWTDISVTILGDTSGTWLTNNGTGLRVWFGFGVGSTFSGTAGVWTAAGLIAPTGATSVVGTNGATFYITGVQLEQNTTATPFERRLYNQELANCQRYFAKLQNDGTGQIAISAGFQTSTTVAAFAINFPVTMRAEPTVTVSNLQASDNVNFSNAWTLGSVDMGYNTGYLNGTISANGAQFRPSFLFTANNTSGFLTLSAEL